MRRHRPEVQFLKTGEVFVSNKSLIEDKFMNDDDSDTEGLQILLFRYVTFGYREFSYIY